MTGVFERFPNDVDVDDDVYDVDDDDEGEVKLFLPEAQLHMYSFKLCCITCAIMVIYIPLFPVSILKINQS